MVFCAAEVAAIYSASYVDSAVIDCFSEPQQMSAPLYTWIMPDIDLRSVTSVANYASLYVSSKFGMSFCFHLCFPALKTSPYFWMCFR